MSRTKVSGLLLATSGLVGAAALLLVLLACAPGRSLASEALDDYWIFRLDYPQQTVFVRRFNSTVEEPWIVGSTRRGSPWWGHIELVPPGHFLSISNWNNSGNVIVDLRSGEHHRLPPRFRPWGIRSNPSGTHLLIDSSRSEDEGAT